MKKSVVYLVFLIFLSLPTLSSAQVDKKMDCSHSTSGNYVSPTLMVDNNGNTSTASTAQSNKKQLDFINLSQTILTALEQNSSQTFSFPKVAIPGEIMQKTSINPQEMNLKGVNSLTLQGDIWKVEFAEGVSEKELQHFFTTIGY